MSNLWPKVSADHPCPICNHGDWSCRFGDRAVLCMRVKSGKPSNDGGFYHFYDDKKPKPQYFTPPRKVKEIDAELMHEKFYLSASVQMITEFGHSLGVFSDSMIQLMVGYSIYDHAWAFPMRDDQNKIIGIRLRNDKGEKWAVTGSRQGLFIPQIKPQKVVYLSEGPTSTAALLTMGLYAIGRPSCNSGGELVRDTLKRLGIRRAVVVADNDSIKSHGSRPGIEGAKKLKKEIGVPSVIWMPSSPLKDARDFLKAGGTKEMIESDISQKIWKNGL